MGDYFRELDRRVHREGDPFVTAMGPRDVYDRVIAEGSSIGDALTAEEQVALAQADAWMRAHRD